MKICVAVLFGGKSVEHEVSVISALQAVRSLDREKYDIVPVYMTKENEMYVGEQVGEIGSYRDIPALLKKSTRVTPIKLDGRMVLTEPKAKFGHKRYERAVDVVLPIVHGTNVEDGALQGYLRTLGVPFAGCDVLASAVGMDKYVMKLVFRDAGLPVLDGRCYAKARYYADEAATLMKIERTFAYPVIVKPVNLGSSVGISKAHDRAELVEALELAFRFAERVLIEPAIVHLREINCAVLGSADDAVASECEEPLNATDILSYEDKYMGGGKSAKAGGSKGMASLSRRIPADIPEALRDKVRTMAVEAFRAIGGNGVARIDFMLDTAENKLYINEINTIPGSLAFYLWEPLGLSYPKLLDRLIELALTRAREEESIFYSFASNILENCNFGGGKAGAKTGSKL